MGTDTRVGRIGAALAMAALMADGGTPPTDNSRGYRRSLEAEARHQEERHRNRESRMAKAEAKRARRRARNLAAAPSQDGGAR